MRLVRGSLAFTSHSRCYNPLMFFDDSITKIGLPFRLCLPCFQIERKRLQKTSAAKEIVKSIV